MRRLLGVLGLALVLSGPAAAHGTYTSSTPADGDDVRKLPSQVTITLTEAPAQGSTVRVVDGCGRNVSEDVLLDGSDLVAVVGGEPAPEPGAWKVSFRSISAVDGHAAKDSFAFKVRGDRDCARQEGPTSEKSESPEISGQPPITNDENESSFPWVPVAIGTIAIIVAALVARRRAAS